MQQIYHIPRQRYQSARVKKIPDHIHDHPEVQWKMNMVLLAQQARKEDEVSFTTSALLLEVSRASLYRWQKLVMNNDWQGLISHSRRPHHVRTTDLTAETIKRFITLRRKYLGLGGEEDCGHDTKRRAHDFSFSYIATAVSKAQR